VTEHSETGRQVLRCRLCLRTATGLTEAGVAGQDDELLLLLDPGRWVVGCAVSVELWRGDCLRDRWTGTLTQPGVLRMLRGNRVRASARLTCRVLLGGCEVFRRTVLLGRPVVDAQGRLPGGTESAASAATLLAYAEELQARLGPSHGTVGNGETNGVS
jgi:hypothetical protein